MRKIVFLFLFVFGGAFVADVVAQDLSRKERRQLKREKRRMPPEDFLAKKNELDDLRGRVESLSNQLERVNQRVKEKDEQIDDQKNEIERLKAQLDQAKKRIEEVQKAKQEVKDISAQQIRPDEGIWFRVQIGAFRNKDLTKYFDKSDTFTGGEMENGAFRYTLGHFRDYWEADTFKKYMREMGVSDAWIVPYKDGQRVPIKDVLEGIIN
ncbi:MAG: Ezrin/radixin/moesin family protein [Cyclobacteriaceae bacterium]|nr:Ezrin/radixin/moesin family protein [Cyclobacteriaceae bacterium]MCH8516710.1 Ezrin/radixin/moesin family protein [Cyclobacteriaceae bacterium]